MGKTTANRRQPGSRLGSFQKTAAQPTRRPNTQKFTEDSPPLQRTRSLYSEASPYFRAKAATLDSSVKKNGAKFIGNIAVSQSIGPQRVFVSREAIVLEAIKAALDLYAKEGRRPLLSNDPHAFELHYSQFSIDRLRHGDKIKDLGCRNFFLTKGAGKSKGNGTTLHEMEKSRRIAELRWYCMLLVI